MASTATFTASARAFETAARSSSDASMIEGQEYGNGSANPFEGEDAGQVKAMKEAEAEYQVVPRLTRAMKAGRLYGTGLLVMVTREADLSEPLDLESVRPGDLIHLLPLDRYDATRFSWDENPYSPTYGAAPADRHVVDQNIDELPTRPRLHVDRFQLLAAL